MSAVPWSRVVPECASTPFFRIERPLVSRTRTQQDWERPSRGPRLLSAAFRHKSGSAATDARERGSKAGTATFRIALLTAAFRVILPPETSQLHVRVLDALARPLGVVVQEWLL